MWKYHSPPANGNNPFLLTFNSDTLSSFLDPPGLVEVPATGGSIGTWGLGMEGWKGLSLAAAAAGRLGSSGRTTSMKMSSALIGCLPRGGPGPMEIPNCRAMNRFKFSRRRCVCGDSLAPGWIMSWAEEFPPAPTGNHRKESNE